MRPSPLDLSVVTTGDGGPLGAQPGRGLQVPGIADGLMTRPAAKVVGDQPTVTPHADAVQVGSDLDAAADHRWVDRVVIAVQPHVMVRGSRSELRQPVTGATGGSGNIPARSTSIRSVGAQPNTRRRRSLTSTISKVASAGE